MTVSDKTESLSLSPALLAFIILMCLVGTLTNSYAANYMRHNFDLSKIMYKILLWSCLIYVIGCIVMLITALCLWVTRLRLWRFSRYSGHKLHFYKKIKCFLISVTLRWHRASVACKIQSF